MLQGISLAVGSTGGSSAAADEDGGRSGLLSCSLLYASASSLDVSSAMASAVALEAALRRHSVTDVEAAR